MNLLEQFNQLKQRRNILLEQNQKRCDIIEAELKKVENFTAARFVLAEVSRQTQEHLKERIEKLVTLCLQSVFDRNFEFKLNNINYSELEHHSTYQSFHSSQCRKEIFRPPTLV